MEEGARNAYRMVHKMKTKNLFEVVSSSFELSFHAFFISPSTLPPPSSYSIPPYIFLILRNKIITEVNMRKGTKQAQKFGRNVTLEK